MSCARWKGCSSAVCARFRCGGDTDEEEPERTEQQQDEGRKGTAMKVRVDDGKCCGAGQCVLLAPEVFDQRDEDGIVVLLDPEPAPDLRPAVREAAAVCPAAAITVDGDDT
jgi:ferredoxin